MEELNKQKTKSKKTRLDILLMERGYAASREKAKAIIMEGNVFINGQREDKAGTAFDLEKIRTLEVKTAAIPYVSRGGLKLEKALSVFPLTVAEKVCIDIGASTGGFTDCMLRNGAEKVYAVDVGHGQLAWQLRNDARVICMERTNFRYVTEEMISEKIAFASCDVSFISLTKILLPAEKLLEDGGEMVCLIKPQFEAGREKVGKKGVVRDKKVHREVIEKVIEYAAKIGLSCRGLSFSPIKGPEGNIEYLLYIQKGRDTMTNVIENNSIPEKEEITDVIIENVIESAHNELVRDKSEGTDESFSCDHK